MRAEATNLTSLHAISEALGKPPEIIDRAIREYAIVVVSLEWPSMEVGEASPEAEAAQDNLLRAVAKSDGASAGYALDRMLLGFEDQGSPKGPAGIKPEYPESDKWACVLLMALMAQIGVASVHLNGARAQFDNDFYVKCHPCDRSYRGA